MVFNYPIFSSTEDKIAISLRVTAKAIDMFVIFVLSAILPYPLGVLLGFAYTLTADGIKEGQSLGKRLFKLKVVHSEDPSPCSLKESAIRNAPLGVATFFGIIPFWGWLLLVLIGIPLVALEIYLMLKSPLGARLGDMMADTKVIELSKTKKKRVS